MSPEHEWHELDGAVLETYRGVASDIALEMRDGCVGFLFGAGLSHGEPSGLPLGGELARRLLRRAYKGDGAAVSPEPALDQLADTMPFEAIMRVTLERVPSEESLLSFLKVHLKYASPQINDGHRAILRMHGAVRQRFPAKLFTTNFDLLLEAAFRGAAGGAGAAVTVAECRYRERLREAERMRAIAVVHLHGALADEVSEARDIWRMEEERVSGENPLLRALHSQLEQNIFVFVGCSLSDVDLRRSYFAVTKFLREREEGKKTYIVSPVKSELERIAATEAWRQRGAVLVPVTATRFLVDLADVVCNPDASLHKLTVMDFVNDEAPRVEGGVKALAAAFPDISEGQFYEYLYHMIRGGRR